MYFRSGLYSKILNKIFNTQCAERAVAQYASCCDTHAVKRARVYVRRTRITFDRVAKGQWFTLDSFVTSYF